MTPCDDATFICLTPVKNEAWILDRFLRCAGTWADHIIVADQHSEDTSREIARRHEKVTLIDNDSEGYDEAYRQRLLLEAARQIPVEGKRILIALDADEALTANWMTSPEWEQVQNLEPGTVIGFKWVNLLPGFEKAWVPPSDKWFGFVDDGSESDPELIHSPRVPMPEGAPRVVLDDIKVFHFQYTDWERMRSKQRWYQAWERLKFPEKRPITIFRQYNHMYGIPDEELYSLQEAWFAGYEERGIDLRKVEKQQKYRWDADVLSMLEEHGKEHFSRIDIWDVDWKARARALGRNGRSELYTDPRSPAERSIHRWLRKTQPQAHAMHIRAIQKLLQIAGW